MRYCALVILIILLIALVVKKFNKDCSYLESLFFTYILLVITSGILGLVFIFIKYW